MKGKIFNAQEVQSMIAGDKRMFREVIKPQPDNARQQFSTIASSTMRGESGKHRFVEVENLNIITHTKSFKCPYQVGQKIFCKESWVLVEDHLDYETGEEWSVREWEGSLEEAQAHLEGDARFGLKASVYYSADGEDENPAEMHDTIGIGGKLLSKKEIPWKSAKSMLQWASRIILQIKSIEVERLQELTFGDALREGISDTFEGSYDGEMLLEKFKDDWNATHKKPEEKFEASPWVWKVQFEVINN